MARKIQPITISAPSAGEMLTAGRQSVRGLGNTAANTNVSGGITQLAGVLNLLGPSGAVVMDPALRAQFDSLQTSVTDATRGPLRQIGKLETQIANLQSKGELRPGQQRRLERLQGQLESLRARVDFQNQRLTDFQNNSLAGAPLPTDRLREAFPELQRTLDEANPYLDRMGQLGAAGERLMGALGRGYRARNIGAQSATAAQAAGVGDIAAGQVGGGTLGQSLMDRALAGVARGGRLSEQEGRDAVQSARQAFAARGMATSGAAIGAELLNRDRFARQRELQDLEIARNVQEQDLQRQQINQNRTLTADEANQRTAMLMNQFNTGELNRVGMFNSELGLRGQIANEDARRLGTQLNTSMLGQAFTTDRMVNQEGLGAALQRGQLAGAANPANMLLQMYGQGQPVGSQSINAGAGMGTNWANNQLQSNMFNANSQMWANAANMYQAPGGGSGSGMAGLIGGLGGAALGAAGVALAPATFGTSLLPAMAGGFGLGAGVGGMMGR